jgi:hypothetical protein
MGTVMGADPRSAWAWSKYETNYPSVEVSAEIARTILDAIPEGDHLEAMAPGVLAAGASVSLSGSDLRKIALSDATHVCARTTRRWIFAPVDGGKPSLMDGAAWDGTATRTGSGFEAGWISKVQGTPVKIFLNGRNDEVEEWITGGAGKDILRLPAVGDLTPVPRISDDDSEGERDAVQEYCQTVADLVMSRSSALQATNGLDLTPAQKDLEQRALRYMLAALTMLQEWEGSAPSLTRAVNTFRHIERLSSVAVRSIESITGRISVRRPTSLDDFYADED